MKRLFLSAVAASVMAATTLPGFAAPPGPPPPHSQTEWKKNKHHNGHKHGNKYGNDYGKHRHGHWKRGQKYGGWNRHPPVRDWHRHHLHRPGPGQQWIRVGNDYILVSILTGVIAGIVAAH